MKKKRDGVFHEHLFLFIVAALSIEEQLSISLHYFSFQNVPSNMITFQTEWGITQETPNREPKISILEPPHNVERDASHSFPGSCTKSANP